MTRYGAGRQFVHRLLTRRTVGNQDLAHTAQRSYDGYRWGAYPEPVTFFRARRRVPVFSDVLYAWRRVVPRLTVVDVPGAHNYLLDRENAGVLAQRLSEALQRSEETWSIR
jgi:acetoacetyl-CoA synthetase